MVFAVTLYIPEKKLGNNSAFLESKIVSIFFCSVSESHGDVALLKLKSPADLTDPMVATVDINVDPSCPQAGENCTVIGWGQKAEGELTKH